jgi:DNA-binding MarR family transcriptional regulator
VWAVVVNSPTGQQTDRIDEIVEFWRQENPDLDVTTKTLSMRLRTVAHLQEQALRRDLAVLGVEMWEVEMLLALRRASGAQRTAGELLREARITSGAITNRLSRLESHGWVRRDVDPGDRRQVLVTLTPAGWARADELIAAKNSAEQRFYAKMPRKTLERLGHDLRTLLATVEARDPSAR